MYKRVLLLVATASFVFVAAPAFAHAPGLSDELLPDGDARPVVVAATLENPGRHNDLLEADLTIEATDNEGITGYEYRWSRVIPGEAHTMDVANPVVSYETVLPDTDYVLEIRAIDTNGWTSDWYGVWSGVTPAVPNVVVAGDSIASGYRRQWFTGDSTCVDSGYSYGSTVVRDVASTLPPAWAPTYTNIAWAGAGVGNMADGGTDSCGVTHPSQVDQIDTLAADNTWNVVVATAGINSTNWTDVIVGLTKDTTFSFSSGGDREVCDLAVRDKWNIDAKRDYISRRTAEVTQAIGERTNARIYWTGYYDVTNTELAPRWKPIGTPCQDDMDYALNELHAAIRAGLSDDVTWVDIDRSIATQKWAGWPHPNPNGHAAIAAAVTQAFGAENGMDS